MAYRYDPDLEFLKNVPSEQLDGLVKILTHTQDGSPHLTEGLTVSDEYKRHYPNHHAYWEKIAEELQLFGGDTLISLLKGNQGVLYKEILCDVCNKLNVQYNAEDSTPVIEQRLLTQIFQKPLEEMPDDERKQLAAKLGLKNMHVITPQAIISMLLYASKGGMLPKIAMLSGTMGLALTTLLTSFSFSGPAYRITIPAILEVAYLRTTIANHPEMQTEAQFQTQNDGETISKKIKDELYEPRSTDFGRVLSLIQAAQNLEPEQKEMVLNAVLYGRTGMSGWDCIGPDSPEVVFELAKSENLRKTYQAAINIAPDSKTAQKLSQILGLAQQKIKRWENPIYQLNQTPSVEFQDFGLKLAVINQLMYQDKTLTPKFDLDLFLDEYPNRCINYERNSFYELMSRRKMAFALQQPEPYTHIIQEVAEYFTNLDIPQILLDEIRSLQIMGNTTLYKQASPYKAENPDIPVQINSDTIADLDLLPSLEEIYVSNKATLPEAFIQKIKSRNISLCVQDEESGKVHEIHKRISKSAS